MKKLILIIGLVVLLISCKAPSTSNADVTAGEAQTAPARSSTLSEAQQIGTSIEQRTKPADSKKMKMESDTLSAALQPGMAYADAREALLKLGWEPVPSANCVANLVGANAESLCRSDPDDFGCKVCKQMTELEDYSGDGHVLANFRHKSNNHAINVYALGMLEDWDVHGDDSRLQYTSWESAQEDKKAD